MKHPSYVYTLSALRARLSRGAKSVLLFWPYTGKLVKVTAKNYKKVSKEFRKIN